MFGILTTDSIEQAIERAGQNPEIKAQMPLWAPWKWQTYWSNCNVARYAERSLGRQLAFQFLFSLEFMDTPWEHALAEFWRMQPESLTKDGLGADEIPSLSAPF